MVSTAHFCTLSFAFLSISLCAGRLLQPPHEHPYTVGTSKNDNKIDSQTSKQGSEPTLVTPDTTATQHAALLPPDSRQRAAAAWAEVPGLDTPQGCPKWMSDYAAFHVQHRGQPGTRYLIHSVRHKQSGLGDRVRGMMFATRLAVATNRVVLFTWGGDPAEPQQFFSPASSIDWTLSGTGYHPSDEPLLNHNNITMESSMGLDMYSWKPKQAETLQKIKKGFLQSKADVQYITIYTNERAEAECAGCPPLDKPMRKQDRAGSSNGSGVSNSAACLFRLLFKPSADLAAAVNDQLLRLFGPSSTTPNFQYSAAHLRLGGLGHEGQLKQDRGTGKGELADVITALTCAQKLSQGAGLSTGQVPVLLITDNHMLRSFVLSGGLAHAVTPDLMPTHMARLNDQEKAENAAVSTFIDLMLLARAQCLVASESGFSETAWMLGGGRSCLGRLHDSGGGGACGGRTP